jgi:hypothetical protein
MRLRRSAVLSAALVAAVLCLPTRMPAQAVPTPESVLGFTPGADRRLVEWPVLVDYYRRLAAASDRVELRELGRTTNGAPFIALVISSPANLARLDELRESNAKLADPRRIGSDAERARLLRDARTIVLITSSVHSTEVGGHLTPALLAYRLAAQSDPDVLTILDQTVLLLVPTLNPDGLTIVSRWYNRTLGTAAEGSGPPELYHPYVGHDNNRDWYAFTQVETQLTVDSLHNVWHPQIVHDIHQQGPYGSRLFLPPYLDPVEPNVDPLIVAGVDALGTAMAWELAGQGKTGVLVQAIYDAWTPARAYQHYHGGVRILSEAASARLATPIEVTPGQLQGRRGFDARTPSWNFPAPWPGGRWTLADIVDYQTSAAFALLRQAALYRARWLTNFLAIGERAVRGWQGWPYGYVIPRVGQPETGLRTMLRVLERGQVEIRTTTTDFAAAGRHYPAGTYVVVLRQPYAAFAKALLERQRYPDLREYPGGPPQPPYDVTAHTLPLLMGVQVVTVPDTLQVALSDPVRIPEPVYVYAGLSARRPIRASDRRIGLYRSYTASIDEGWTRWVLDTWSVPYSSLVDSVIRAGRLHDRFDAIVIPDLTARDITDGLPDSYPAPFAGGLGASGVAALRAFVRDGGTLVTLDGASTWAITTFELPMRDVAGELDPREFFAPGSIFGIEVDTLSPLAAGVPPSSIAWFERSPLFEIQDTTRARIIARFPSRPQDVLLSGWVLGPEHAAGRPALVEAPYGRGRVVLFGFRPQYRGQSLATYPLLFNALRTETR